MIIQLQHGVDLARGQALVRSVGGHAGPGLHIINGLSATLTADAARRLARSPQVHAVSLNSTLLQTWHYGAPGPWQLSTTYDQSVHATGLWRRSTGRGVGVAVIDTGDHRRPPGLPHLPLELDLARDRLGGHRSRRLHRR